MRYPHIVKYKGVWYPAGAEVPVGQPEPEIVEVPEEPEEEVEEKPAYSRRAIQQLRKAEALELAEKLGIPTNEETTGGQLKTALLEYYGY